MRTGGTHRRLASTLGLAVIVACAGLATPAAAQPVGTAFTFQGSLASGGSPASGMHDFRFRLYDAAGAGSQIGATLCADNVLLTAGGFAVSVDFGAVYAGQKVFLEIDVRQDSGLGCGDGTGYTTLSPRQELTPTPYSVYSTGAATATAATTAVSATNAALAANATNLNGQPDTFYRNAGNLTGTLPGGALSGAYSGAVTLDNAANAFTGSGAGLTALNAANLSTGTLGDLRLSANVAMRNAANTFGNFLNTFGGNVGIGTGSPNGRLEVKGSVVLRDTGNNPALRISSSTAGFGADPEFVVQDAAGAVGNNTAFHLSRNALWTAADLQYHPIDNAQPASSVQYGNGGGISFLYAAPGLDPIAWQNNLTIDGPTGTVNVATGNLGIGVSAPTYPLNFGVATGDKISLSGTTVNHYGFGIQTNLMQIHTNGSASDIAFGYGSSAAMTETMRIKGTGQVAMGFATPGDTTLHVFTATRGSAATVESSLVGGAALSALSTAATGDSWGGSFSTQSTAGTGLYAIASANTGVSYGVRGYTDSAGTNAIGVRGEALRAGANFGVYGMSAGGTSFGVYANGKLGASGTKSFMIDHPLDPQNKVLYHYSAESPDVLNIYSGVVNLDGAGEAWVTLPEYYAAINVDPRYSLTSVGAPAPMLHVAQEVQGNTFKIAGGAPGAKVSWEIKAVRHDRFVEEYGAPVEQDKAIENKGKYIRPELYGRPAEMGQFYTTMPRIPAPTAPAATLTPSN